MELLFIGIIVGIVIMKLWYGIRYYMYFRKNTDTGGKEGDKLK